MALCEFWVLILKPSPMSHASSSSLALHSTPAHLMLTKGNETVSPPTACAPFTAFRVNPVWPSSPGLFPVLEHNSSSTFLLSGVTDWTHRQPRV